MAILAPASGASVDFRELTGWWAMVVMTEGRGTSLADLIVVDGSLFC